MPAPMSQIETPTRAGASGPPVTEADAGFGLDQHVVGLSLRVGPAVAVARHRADDQPRVIAAQALDGRSRAWPPRGLEILDEHVGLGEHRLEQRFVAGLARSRTMDSLPRLSQTKYVLCLAPARRSRGRNRPPPLDLDDAAPASARRHEHSGAATACLQRERPGCLPKVATWIPYRSSLPGLVPGIHALAAP